MNDSSLLVLSVAFSALSSLGVGTVVLYLRSINSRVTTVEARLEAADKAVASLGVTQKQCRIERARETVTVEEHVRDKSLMREDYRRMAEVLSTLNGKLAVVERLPEISAAITKAAAESVFAAMQRQEGGQA